jgi:ubiquinone biosynthesis protein UbiJ
MALSRYANRTFTMVVMGFSMHFMILANGWVEEVEAPTEVTLTFQNAVFEKIMQGLEPGVGDIHVNGEHYLGMSLLPLLGDIRYYLNDDLARLFGNGAAGVLMKQHDKAKATVNHVFSSLQAQIKDYAQEEQAILVNQMVFDQHKAALRQLRDDVARLEARLNTFTQ